MGWGLDYAAIQGTTHAPVFAWEYHRQGRYGTEPGRHRLCRQAHFCEIEVDTETGEINVKRVMNVNDVGKALSPETVEGQKYGGTYMGIGRNLMEEYVWEPGQACCSTEAYLITNGQPCSTSGPFKRSSWRPGWV